MGSAKDDDKIPKTLEDSSDVKDGSGDKDVDDVNDLSTSKDTNLQKLEGKEAGKNVAKPSSKNTKGDESTKVTPQLTKDVKTPKNDEDDLGDKKDGETDEDDKTDAKTSKESVKEGTKAKDTQTPKKDEDEAGGKTDHKAVNERKEARKNDGKNAEDSVKEGSNAKVEGRDGELKDGVSDDETWDQERKEAMQASNREEEDREKG